MLFVGLFVHLLLVFAFLFFLYGKRDLFLHLFGLFLLFVALGGAHPGLLLFEFVIELVLELLIGGDVVFVLLCS